MPELFRISDVEIFALGEGECLVRQVGAGRPVSIDEAGARLLASCVDYQPLDKHAHAWAAFLDRQKVEQASRQSPRWLARVIDASAQVAAEPSMKLVEQTRSTLERFAVQGLLTARSTFPSNSDGESPAGVFALGFTTRRRVEELRRALGSYARNFRTFGREPEIVVIDDSRSSSDEAETEEMLRDFQRDSGLRMRFAGLPERERYVADLAREARTAPDIVRFALLGDERCPITTGAARNCLLLDCGGSRYVLADDDGVCRLAPAPEAREGLDIVSRNDPTQFWFFESREALHSQVELTDQVDLIGLHEGLLGRSAASLADADTGLAGASPAFEGRLRRRGAVVRTSMAGVVGDSGVASTAYLSAEPKSIARLTISEDFYRAAVESRQMLRAPQRATLSEGFLTMAGNLGIDATSLFPPFPPVQRNSDGIMGRFLQNCFPTSCRGYLNWAALHDPAAARSQSLDGWFDEIRSIRFADALTVFLRNRDAEPALENPGEALRTLGARFLRLGKIPLDSYAEELRRRLVAREASRLAHSRRRDPEGIPAFYLALNRRYAEVMQDALTRDEYLLPRDLPEKSLRLTQSLTGRLGGLLEAWPRVWNAMTWLRANGRRLSRPVE